MTESINKSCLTMSHLAGLNGMTSLNTTWRFRAPQYPTAVYVNSIQCKSLNDKVAITQIIPKFYNAPEIIYYDSCLANLYAALKRQFTATPQPNAVFLQKFEKWFLSVIMPEIKMLLSDFHYSYDVWYNHLTANQQRAMDDLSKDRNTLLDIYAVIFCKAEKQMMEAGAYPKNRAISAMCDAHKYVMGPVVYALEQYFKKI